MSLLAANNALLANAGLVLTPPLSHFEFEEGTGTTSVNLGSNSTAALMVNILDPELNWVTGLNGSFAIERLETISTSVSVELGEDAFDVNGAFSYCYLAKAPPVLTNQGCFIGTAEAARTDDNNNFQLKMQSAELRIVCRNNDPLLYNPTSTTSPFVANGVYHMGVTHALDGTVRGYVDGIEIITSNIPTDQILGPHTNRMGVVLNLAGTNGTGIWDSFRSWNTVISQEEMAYYSTLRN